MAERRMFAKTIIDSDAFLDMPLSTQALYFHLSMRADDDGFINNPKKIQRMIGASDDDFKVLLAKRFLIPFESGIVVIKHWRIHNYIRSDRYKETVYQEEKALLEVKENGTYTISQNVGIPLGIPNDNHSVYRLDTQDRLSKDIDNKDILSGDPDPMVGQIDDIINYLNQKTGKNFRPNTKAYRSVIKARFKEGFRKEDFFNVIDKKTAEWGKDKRMSEYLRPQTLFGTKMDSYIQSAPKAVAKSYGEDGVSEW